MNKIQTNGTQNRLFIVQPIKLSQYASLFLAAIFSYPVFSRVVPLKIFSEKGLIIVLLTLVISLLTLFSRLLFIFFKHKMNILLNLEYIIELAEMFYVYIISFMVTMIFSTILNDFYDYLGIITLISGLLVTMVRNVVTIDKMNSKIRYSLHYTSKIFGVTYYYKPNIDHLYLTSWSDDGGYSGYQLRIMYSDESYHILESGWDFRDWIKNQTIKIADFLDIKAIHDDRVEWGSNTNILREKGPSQNLG